jgi:hypothetical protein
MAVIREIRKVHRQSGAHPIVGFDERAGTLFAQVPVVSNSVRFLIVVAAMFSSFQSSIEGSDDRQRGCWKLDVNCYQAESPSAGRRQPPSIPERPLPPPTQAARR